MPDPWTEQHRPRTLAQVLGNPQALATVRQWAEAWRAGRPKERALLLAGPPGSGKTSTAHALAAEQGWGVVELNASDSRSADAIRRVAGVGAVHQTFTVEGEYRDSRKGELKLIILDEADNLVERGSETKDDSGKDLGDRGGKRAIVETVTQTQQPIVLIVNDAYGLLRGSGEKLRRLCVTVNYRRLATPSVRKVLRDVAQAQGVAVAEDVLQAIASRAQGDLRSAINDLEAVASGQERVDSLGALDLAVRNRTESAFDMVAAVLKGTDLRRAVDAARNVDEPPDFLVAWLDENVPYEYRDPRDLVRAYEHLSRADVFLGRTMRRQAFSMWGYATEVAAGGVAAAKETRYATPPRYRFPGWIRAMGASKGRRAMRDRVGAKLGGYVHMGRRRAVREMVPFLQEVAPRQTRLAVEVAMVCDLDEDEIRFLLGEDVPKALADEVVARVERRRREGAAAKETLEPEAEGAAEEPVRTPETDSRYRRTSLGDF